MGANKDIELKLHVPIDTPSTIDSAFVCRLAAAYLRLLERVAQEDGRELSFKGVRLEGGSTVLAVLPSDVEVAQAAADEAAPYVSGDVEAPPGIEAHAREVSEVLQEKLLGTGADIIIGPWSKPLHHRPHTDRSLAAELISIRAKVVRVGGVRPAARFEAASEENSFTLSLAKPEDAPALGALLYREIDIVATVRRDEDDRIVGGSLDEWEALEPGSGVEAWREWFQKSCPEWNDVKDVEAELGRSDEGDAAHDDHH